MTDETPAPKFETAEWDTVNRQFYAPSRKSVGCSGIQLADIDNVQNFDTFRMQWSAGSISSTRRANILSTLSEGVRVGTLTVVIPSCVVTSEKLCSMFEKKSVDLCQFPTSQ